MGFVLNTVNNPVKGTVRRFEGLGFSIWLPDRWRVHASTDDYDHERPDWEKLLLEELEETPRSKLRKELRAEMEAIQQQMVEAKKNELARFQERLKQEVSWEFELVNKERLTPIIERIRNRQT